MVRVLGATEERREDGFDFRPSLGSDLRRPSSFFASLSTFTLCIIPMNLGREGMKGQSGRDHCTEWAWVRAAGS
jgi:hypothetical protein